jgi:hypothetical protein
VKINKDNFKLYCHYNKERSSIYYKKEILKEPPHWTSDKILQKYKFTNIHRKHDKESKWLINNIINLEHISQSDKILIGMQHYLPLNDRTWNLIDIENSFCEFNKYFNYNIKSRNRKRYYKHNTSLSLDRFV